jgi:hypothetical protein
MNVAGVFKLEDGLLYFILPTLTFFQAMGHNQKNALIRLLATDEGFILRI